MSLNINKTCVGACATHIKACLIIEIFRDWFIFKTKQQRTLLNSNRAVQNTSATLFGSCVSMSHFCFFVYFIYPLHANPTKWLNTLKPFFRGLMLKGLKFVSIVLFVKNPIVSYRICYRV